MTERKGSQVKKSASQKAKAKTTSKARKPLLVLSKVSGLSPDSCAEPERKAKALGYDVLVLPPGVTAYIALT